MNIPWTARPNPRIKRKGGVAYEEIHIKSIDFCNHIFNNFRNKSKLVAHTPNVATNF